MPAENQVEILISAKDEVSRVLQNVGSEFGSLGAVISRFSSGALPAIAIGMGAVGAAAFGLSKRLADTAEQLDRLSKNTGVSMENLQIARRVIQEAGGNADQFTTALVFLNRQIATGSPLLAQLGIKTDDAFQAALQLGRAFAAGGREADKIFFATKLLGQGSTALIGDLERLGTSFGELTAEMREAGIVLSRDTVRAGLELDRQLDRFGRNWEGLMNRIGAAVLPATNAILEFISAALRLGPTVAMVQALFGRGQADAGLVLPSGMLSAHQVMTGPRIPTAPDLRRLEALEKLREILRGTGIDAEFALRKLEELDRQAERSKLIEILGPVVAHPELGPSASRIRHLAGVTETGDLIPDLSRLPGITEKVAVPELELDPWLNMVERWKQSVEDMLSASEVLDRSMRAVLFGLQSSFEIAFSSILSQTQSFGEAMKTAFRSLVDYIIAELARLAALKVFQFLLNLVFPGLGSAIGGGTNVISTEIPPALPPIRSGPIGSTVQASGSAGGGNTYVIQTIDARDVVRELTSPAGSMRRANDVLRFQGAF